MIKEFMIKSHVNFRKIMWVVAVIAVISSPCVAVWCETALPTTPDSLQLEPESNTSGSGRQMTDIMDIKPNLAIGYNPDILFYALIAGGILLTVALITAVVLIYRNKRKNSKAQDITACLPADEEAFQLLNRVKPLIESDGRMFYFQLSAIFRGYIGKRFHVDALEMTTEELMPCMLRLDIDGSLQQGARELLMAGDPVKFAGKIPETGRMRTHLEFAETFVRKTRETAVSRES